MSGIWAAYNRALASNPLLVKALTSFTGFTVGDILAQKFINPDDEYDFARTLRLGSFGALVHGPTGHWFYGMLDNKLPGTKPITVASKVAIDQTIWNPIFGCMFFTYLGLTEGKSMDDIVKKIESDLATAVMGSWSVWIPAHTINFKFVPTSQRLLYINTIQIGYNVFLSFLGNKKADGDEDDALASAKGEEMERFAKDVMPSKEERENMKANMREGVDEMKGDVRSIKKDIRGGVDKVQDDAADVRKGARELAHNMKEDASAIKARASRKADNLKGTSKELGHVAGELKDNVRADVGDAAEDAKQVLRARGMLDGLDIDARTPEEKAKDAKHKEYEEAKAKLGWKP